MSKAFSNHKDSYVNSKRFLKLKKEYLKNLDKETKKRGIQTTKDKWNQ